MMEYYCIGDTLITHDILYNEILNDKIRNYERLNPEIIVKECPQILKFIIIQNILTLRLLYENNNINADKEYMQYLNQEIIKNHGNKFNNENEDNIEIIKAKKEYDFILKHDNITDEFHSDYDILHEEIDYDR